MDSCSTDEAQQQVMLERRRHTTDALCADVTAVIARVEAVRSAEWDSPAAARFEAAVAGLCADLRQAQLRLDDSAWELARAAAAVAP